MPEPMIGEVYAAFDASCALIYRQAMDRSRGGVVRVDDLLAALAASRPTETGTILGLTTQEIDRLAQRVSPGPLWAPMSNDPALRRLLGDAFGFMRAQGRNSMTCLDVLQAARPQTIRPIPTYHPPPPRPKPEISVLLSAWLAAQELPTADAEIALAKLSNEITSFSPG